MPTRLSFPLLLLISLLFPAHAQAHRSPGLGSFTSYVTFTVPAGTASYQFTGNVMFSPVSSESVRRLSGVGTLSLVSAQAGAAPTPAFSFAAFSAAAAIPVSVSSQNYTWSGTASFTPSGLYCTIGGTGSFTLGPAPIPVPPPPPPPALLAINAVIPNTAAPGQSVTLTGTGFGSTPGSVAWGLTTLTVQSWSAVTVQAAIPLGVTAGAAAVRLVRADGLAATGPVLTISPVPIPVPVPPPPPPPGPGKVWNVRDHGAKGDGVANDTPFIQAVIQQAQAGDTLYFPAGTYLCNDALKFNHKNSLTLNGDGPTSIIRTTSSYSLMIGTGGEPGTGYVIQNLEFAGNPNATAQTSVAQSGGIQCFGPTGTVIKNCGFSWTGCLLQESGASVGTQVTNCDIEGWGRVAVFCNGGETISHCILNQLDASKFTESTSHAVYIHGGASNIEVSDCQISNVRKYAAQCYSEAVGTTISNIRFLRDTITNCAHGITVDQSQPTAGTTSHLLIDHVQFSGIYSGPAVALHDGNDITITNNSIVNGGSVGIELGNWAPYDLPGESVNNCLIQGNTVTGNDTGLWALASNGGFFQNIQVAGNTFTGNRAANIRLDNNPAGITLQGNVTAAHPTLKHGR